MWLFQVHIKENRAIDAPQKNLTYCWKADAKTGRMSFVLQVIPTKWAVLPIKINKVGKKEKSLKVISCKWKHLEGRRYLFWINCAKLCLFFLSFQVLADDQRNITWSLATHSLNLATTSHYLDWSWWGRYMLFLTRKELISTENPPLLMLLLSIFSYEEILMSFWNSAHC